MNKPFLNEIALTAPALAEILDSMLEFNPLLRKSASELLMHEYFNDIRIPENEVRCEHKLELDIDRDEFFDSTTERFTFTNEELIERLDNLLFHNDK